MKKDLKLRIILVSFVIFLSLVYALPSTPLYRYFPGGIKKILPSRKVNLGLDLQGGTHLVLEIDTREAIEMEIHNYAREMRQILKRKGIHVISVGSSEKIKMRLVIKLENKMDIKRAQKILSGEYGDWEIETSGGDEVLMTLSSKKFARIENALQRQAVEIIRNRIDEFGVAEPSIQPQGKNRIVVQLPGLKSPERAKALIGKTAKLTFHIAKKTSDTWNIISKIDEKAGVDIRQYLKTVEGLSGINFKQEDANEIADLLGKDKVGEFIPRDCRFAFGKMEESESGRRYQGLYLIKKKPELGGELLRHAYVSYQGMSPVVNIQFDRKGARLFEKITGANKGEPLAIVLDGIVQSAPVIEEKIPRTSTGYIRGRFDSAEANDLAIMLKAGALPASIKIVFEQTVGPSLGLDSIRKGIKAAVVGILFVLAFMAVYYLLCGLLSDFALCLNLLILLAVLAGLGATLTLPGIAGIILTMGMSVDANVIIFERIREEIKSGKSIRASIAGGYRKAFRTILDANVTTLIAALVLFQFGTGPIRGFAVTLSIGIIGSMFTAIVVTRLILDLLSTRRKFNKLTMLQLIPKSSIRFVERRRAAFILSLAVIIVGSVFIVRRGTDNLGIDFRGGTMLLRGFSENVPIDRIRRSLGRAGFYESTLQQFDEGKGIIIRTEGESGAVGQIDESLRKEFGNTLKDPEEFGQTSFVGPVVGKDLSRQAQLAILFALIGIVIYVSWRFEFKFAIAAIIALVHDVFITVGIFSFTGREITLPVIAALLTIIGYSLNDTIVVFDRIRENMRFFRKESFAKVVNISINQTLSRTVLTSLTTFMVVASLFVFGGEAIHDFSFAMLVGIVVGTYSSIFVASPILVQWYGKGKRKR